ncbi:hypothetical protein [Nocardia sp. bgisy118]|uniref:hypothetical protein n=1 Tax=Nocardia sp. bgisy118 TaxID=3413786 RepID=UPI003F49CE43
MTDVVRARDVVDLVPEIVLEEVASAFGETLHDHGAFGDLQHVAAEALYPRRGRRGVWVEPIVGASLDLGDRADIAQLSHAVVPVVVGDTVREGHPAGMSCETEATRTVYRRTA